MMAGCGLCHSCGAKTGSCGICPACKRALPNVHPNALGECWTHQGQALTRPIRKPSLLGLQASARKSFGMDHFEELDADHGRDLGRRDE